MPSYFPLKTQEKDLKMFLFNKYSMRPVCLALLWALDIAE